jgi:hypothetical protein
MKKSNIAFIFIGVFGIAIFAAYWLSRPGDPQKNPAPTAQQFAALVAQLMQPNAAAADLAAEQLIKIGAPALAPLAAARAATQDVLLQARIDAVTKAIASQPRQPMAGQPLTAQPVVPNLAVPLPKFDDEPFELRTTNIRNFTTADGKQYRVTQITEGNKSKLTVEVSNPAGQIIERVEAANEAELARVNPQLAAILRQNEGVGDREQIVQGPGMHRRVIVRGGGGGIILNIGGGGGLFGNRGNPLPNMPRPEAPASAPVGDFGAKLAETADGVRVIDVTPNSRAASSGLQPADIITKINGRQVNSLDDADDLIQKADPAQPLKLEVTRRGEIVALP